MSDHTLPTLTSNYATVLTELGNRTIDSMKFSRSDQITITANLITTGYIRLNTSSRQLEEDTSLTTTKTWTPIAFNAATVTTNANLTGPITSSGNATSIASQTGTGTTFVMNTNPTITGTLTVTGVLTAATHIFNIDSIELNSVNTGNRNCYIDFHSDDTYTDNSLRIIRNAGINGASELITRGTGGVGLTTIEAGDFWVNTTNVRRLTIAANGTAFFESANSVVYSTGTAGYGSFYARGSGTNDSYIFMGNITSGERGRISSVNSGSMFFGTIAGLTQFRVDHVASATTYIVIGGSNGAAPYFTTNTGGSLASLVQFIALGQQAASSTMITATGFLGGLMCQSSGTGATAGAAYMSFLRTGNFGSYLGIDTDNLWKFGGWSAATVLSINASNGDFSCLGVGNFSGVYAGVTNSGDAYLRAVSTGTIQSARVQIIGRQSSVDNEWNIIAAGNGLDGPILRITRGTWTNSALFSINSSGDVNIARYAFAAYWNSSDDVTGTAVTYIMVKAGDNYYRSGSAALVSTFLQGSGLTSSLCGFRGIPQNSQSTAYTFVAADAGKHIFHPSADTTARVFTIPANSAVTYDIGTAITIINQNGAGVITIAITTDILRLAGAGTTGSRTLSANGIATLVKVTSTEWIISGSGVG